MGDGLTFNTLREANTRRMLTDKYSVCERTWTTAHWLQAMVGEVGELANILKKVDRGDFPRVVAYPQIAAELADIQTYLDILAHKLNINLGEATIGKFNIVSKRVGSDVYISDDGSDWYIQPLPGEG